MAYIKAPDFAIRSITWSLDRPAQSNVSGWTGRRTVVTAPWHAKWRGQVEIAPLQGEANFQALRSFFARAKGSLNTFRLYATAGTQNSNSGVTMQGTAAAGSTVFTLTGVGAALEEGEFITVNGQLLIITETSVLVGSDQAVWFEPPLRAAATVGTGVVTSRPYALVHLAQPTFGYSISPGRLFATSFDVEEAILETDGASVPETELVTNGTFATSTTGWTAINATLSVSSARLRVANAGAFNGVGYQSIAVIPRQTYTLGWDAFDGTGGALMRVGNTSTGSEYVDAYGAGTGRSATFTPTQSPIYIAGWVNSTIDTQYAEFDNISLKES